MSAIEDYDGGRQSSDIVSWSLTKYTENLPAPDVLELTQQSVFEQQCQNKQICLVSVLPNILECQSKCRNAHLKTLHHMAEKHKRQQWGWLWVEGGKQLELESALGIGGFGYPAMAAVNIRKGKYILLRGSFSETGLTEFLRDLSYGRGTTTPLKNSSLPDIVTSVPWDGKDGELIIDEDVDLSDVVLDDKNEL